jgi:cyclopropane fatty-acyl-phospholipid synthase-like methyltransferase
MFARFKLQSDPMFTDLPKILEKRREDVETILDIGCGYGVPGCWCLEYFPDAQIIAVDPDPERVRVASLAMGTRGTVLEDTATEMPALPEPPDLILLLDMLHYLDDDSIRLLFSNCFQSIADKGILLTRYVIRPDTTPSWSWKLEDFRIKLSGGEAHYRSAAQMEKLMEQSGFAIESSRVSPSNPELVWLIGRAEKR